MRPLLTILALLAFPSAAFAQMPAGAAPNRIPPFTTAQSNAAASRGITVTGSATKRVPASRALVSLYFFDRTVGLNATTMQPVVDALVKSGVSKDDISLPQSFGSPAVLNNATIVATMPNPTVAAMQTGIANVGAAIAGMKDVSLGSAQVTLQADNCSDQLDDVRATAIKNARSKADATAKDLDVHVGSVINVVSNDQMGPTGTCAWQYTVGQNNNGMISSPDDYVSVPVYASVTITYAIKN